MTRMADRPPPDECANCGAAIPPQARSCPECGADARTGWRESSIYDGLDLPDAAYSDDESSAPRTPASRRGLPWFWLLAAGLALVFFILGLLTFR